MVEALFLVASEKLLPGILLPRNAESEMLPDAEVVAELQVRRRPVIVVRPGSVVTRLSFHHLTIAHPQHTLAGTHQFPEGRPSFWRRCDDDYLRQPPHLLIAKSIDGGNFIYAVQRPESLYVQLQLIVLVIRQMQLTDRHFITQIIEIGLLVHPR